MMRKILCAAFALVIILEVSAFALGESDYRELLKDSEFASADKALHQAWSDAKKAMTQEEFDALKTDQREWAKTLRDEEAEELMDFQGYSKVMAYIAVTNERVKAIRAMFTKDIASESSSPSKITSGIIKADKDYITVIAEGYAENKQKALESAYIDAVRLAVGAIISAKTELNNDELSESIIMHSRGVIEGFDILDEKNEGGLTRLYIQAKVHREILQDETKRYMEAQTVKADVQGAVKAQMNEDAKEKTIQAKQKSGAELLREVLESYGPENFFSATLNPKIFYDEKTKKTYIQVTEKFNQSVFWDEFLPKLRNALDGVAVKKTKEFYEDRVRKVNQTLNKEGYVELRTKRYGLSNPYDFDVKKIYSVVIPDDVASYTVYEMPFGPFGGGRRSLKEQLGKVEPELRDIGLLLLSYISKMSRSFTYSITYFDKENDIISVQVIRKNSAMFTVYPSFNNLASKYNCYESVLGMSFAPGYFYDMRKQLGKKAFFVLDTENYNLAHPNEGYEVELDSEELQRLDTMKFEVIFEQ